MATYNSSPNILNNCVKSTEALQSSAAYFVPSPTPLIGLNSSSFAASASAIENHYIDIQKNIPNLTHHVNSSSSYTYMEIKREPCQVSEVTTSNSLQSSNQHNSKTMSSTMTTMVKIESTSPKMPEMEKVGSQMHISNSVPVGIAVARKRHQENNLHTTPMQPPRDLNYFGIRVADIGGVASSGCGNIYFAGADLISGARSEDMNTGIHNVNRSASTYWQYPNTFPIESVISMSPVGLQYSRDASRGQLVLLPTAAAMDSFQQAAFLWPPYMQQNAAGALQSSPNFIFPSMSPQANAQSQSFGAPLQLLGSNYLTAATAAATSTLCHHSQISGNRFVSVSSDTKRIEQSQKHSAMKIEDWNIEHNVLNKNSLISHHAAPDRVDKSKVGGETNNLEMLTNTNLAGAMPTLLHHEQSHNAFSHNTPEFINMPIIPSNFIATPDTIRLTPPEINQVEVGAIYKNSTLRVPSFSKTPEMQDVNVQTDTPVCSEDENSSLEVSTAENMSSSIQHHEKNKLIYNLPSIQCHNNLGGCKALSKENVGEPPQMYGASNNDYSNEKTAYIMQGKCAFDNECTPINKNKCFNSDIPIGLPSAESSSFKSTNPQLLEMSGLELLSNISTGSFVCHNSLKTVCVKEEPSELLENEHRNQSLNNYESYANGGNHLNTQYSNPSDEKEIQNTIHTPVESSEPLLGGLNLLCALAEQRIHEEVESNNFNHPVEEHISDVKKRKRRHSKTKSSRKSRYYKKNKKKFAKERKEYLKAAGLKSECVDVHANLRGAFKKVDSNYKKLNKWPDPEEFFKAMESDMRMRLADITRQYRKKKRKLDEISKIKKRKKASSSEYKFANISCKNPNFICFLDQFQSTSSNFPPPAENNENQVKAFRAKNNSECAPETSEDNKEPHSEGVYPPKFKKRTSSHNSILGEKLRCKERKGKRKQALEGDRNAVGSRLPTLECQQPATVIKSEDKVEVDIDKQLVLSNDHLYRKETRVLTDMGGLFYAGILKPLQPPDVYAITLDGERGNKSHIMSREEIFKDTILEVVPKTIEEVPTGTRLCAYWSQQYRCLYPGRAIDSETTDIGSDFVSVEFDDGDSGRIRLPNIRFLLSDYPIVEYSENPLNALGKNKKSANVKSTSIDSMSKESFKEEMRVPFIQESNQDTYTHKIDKKKSQFDNNLPSTSNLGECVRKHRKHKKRKKHKKHHRKSSIKTSTAVIDNKDHSDEEVTQPVVEDEASNFDFRGNNGHMNTNNCEPETLVNINSEKRRDQTLCEHVKSEAIGLDDEDSTSNVVSEASDEANPNEKIDYNNGKGSKIAAFLPERQLWGWLGQAYRKAGLKGRARKQFYKSITRGKETITVGECAVFLSTGRPDRPYIGRIEAMWETTSSNKVVRVRWFYHPEETTGCPILKYPGALFDSPHEDENDVQTISHRCEVIEFSMYIAKFGSDTRQYQSIYDNNDTYYLSGYYNPRLQILKLQPDIPTEMNNSI